MHIFLAKAKTENLFQIFIRLYFLFLKSRLKNDGFQLIHLALNLLSHHGKRILSQDAKLAICDNFVE
ncbi:MAG: hypothetical protein EA343_08920 [Nodularia sp. (in: Bacteria)]|nr:MAG: hypothetical protein EA343_08920 [Nodularia sp. (in: cyanobacteria)]